MFQNGKPQTANYDKWIPKWKTRFDGSFVVVELEVGRVALYIIKQQMRKVGIERITGTTTPTRATARHSKSDLR